MYKTRPFQLHDPFLTKSFWCNISVMCIGIILALLSAAVFFEFFDLYGGKTFVTTIFLQEPMSLKAAAAQENEPAKKEKESFAVLTAGAHKNNYAFRGDKNVPLMKFKLAAQEDVFLKELVLTMDQLSKTYDLKNIQLYKEHTILQETSFFEGRGVFKDLLIKLPQNKEIWFYIKGDVSEQANVGDRIRLLFVDREDLKITNVAGDSLAVKSDYPVKGDIVSVIGKTLTEEVIPH